ncbi:hypothetical protein MZT54_26270, partial [Escherichia coli]|uniref:hypothetical protein n=1 Tax=Escherichia coli TaxID=562 RepID=UPI00345980AE
TVRHQPVERHHAVFCRGPFPRAPRQQVSRRVVLPARPFPRAPRAARRVTVMMRNTGWWK